MRGLARWAGLLAERSAAIGRPVEVDGPALLGERAALARMQRNGSVSCGGASRLLRAADEWIVVSLPREDDVATVPAWLEVEPSVTDPWTVVEREVALRLAAEVVARGRLLGLAVAVVGEVSASVSADGPFADLPVGATASGAADPCRELAGLTVVDLSSLWAGPLCGQLLMAAGAHVIKVESEQRLDGARRGSAGFFALLNEGKASELVDLASERGRARLRSLLAGADAVIEASRPRALEQLGINAMSLVRHTRPRVWLSITGYGRDAPGRDWVGFGDDTAAAGGLVAWDEDGPCFCADAVADPCTGLAAAAAVLSALTHGGRWLLDISLARTAASLSGDRPQLAERWEGSIAPPRARA